MQQYLFLRSSAMNTCIDLLYLTLDLFWTFQMWCATGVNLSGGVTKDGGAIVGASVFYNNNNNNVVKQDNVDIEINTEIDESMEMKKLDEELKVWYFFFHS